MQASEEVNVSNDDWIMADMLQQKALCLLRTSKPMHVRRGLEDADMLQQSTAEFLLLQHVSILQPPPYVCAISHEASSV